MMTTLNARDPHTRARKHPSNDHAASSEGSRIKLGSRKVRYQSSYIKRGYRPEHKAAQGDVVNLTPIPRQEVFVSVEEHEMTDMQKGSLDWKIGEHTAVNECDSPV